MWCLVSLGLLHDVTIPRGLIIWQALLASAIIGQNCYCITICGHMSLPSLCVNKHLHHTVSCGGWQSGSQWFIYFSSLSQMMLSGSIVIDLHANTFRIQQAWLSGCTYLSNVGFCHVTHVVREWCKASRRWRICEYCSVFTSETKVSGWNSREFAKKSWKVAMATRQKGNCFSCLSAEILLCSHANGEPILFSFLLYSLQVLSTLMPYQK